MTEQNLCIGDKVMWCGGFGRHAPQEAVVKHIEITNPGEKYGQEVDCVRWSVVKADCVVVDLDNGHWAYGSQLEPTR